MNIANCNGDFRCHSWTELENFIRKSSLNMFNDIWLNENTDYPCLAILISGNHACVHYFLNDKGDMWQSIGYGNENVSFVSNGDELDMPADSVITLDEAIECINNFMIH